MAKQFLELDPIKFKSPASPGKYRLYLDEDTGALFLIDDQRNEAYVVSNLAVANAVGQAPQIVATQFAGASFPEALIQLQDTTGLTLSAGTLGRNGSSDLVMHDGVTPSGIVIASFGENVYRGSVTISAAEIGTAPFTKTLARVPITADKAVLNQKVAIYGNIQLQVLEGGTGSFGVQAKLGFGIGSALGGAVPDYALLISPNFPSVDAASEKISNDFFSYQGEFTDYSGDLYLEKVAAGLNRFNWASSAEVAVNWPLAATGFVITPAVDDYIDLAYSHEASPTDITEIRINYDFTVVWL